MKNVIIIIIAISLLSTLVSHCSSQSFNDVYVIPISDGDVELARKALADDVVDQAGWTLLATAVYMDNVPMLQTLLKAGSDPFADMAPYENAIAAAVSHESENVLVLFKELEFDVDLYFRKAEEEKSRLEMEKKAEKFDKVGKGNARSLLMKTLNSPDSYSEISAELAWAGSDEQGRPAGIYRFEFSAQNGFGASMRGCRYVSFWLSSGNKVGYYSNTYMQPCESWGNGDQQAAVETLVRLNFQRETQRTNNN